MDIYPNIIDIDPSCIINVVRNALSKIDPRLIDHGERVGFIAREICAQTGEALDVSKLFVLCVLHDIGAYKTDEIDEMVKFETEAPFDHSLYGYLFIKNTNHLSEHAEAILYHHTDYASLPEINSVNSKYAQIIHLADRADIVLGTQKPDLSVLRRYSGGVFAPKYVEALLSADMRTDFSRKIASGEYKRHIPELIRSLEISAVDVIDYLKLLVYAIDFRSPHTVTHTADTMIISLALGKHFCLGTEELRKLYTSAFLHDIGKIGIPYQILDKPGRLTDGEFIIVKGHISEGEEILRGVIGDEICDIALRHHEKLDGSGYIRGLTGSELTLPQRIVAVADILSALSQRRPYKEPYHKERVIKIICDMRDSGLICPRTVNAAVADYDAILNATGEINNPIAKLYSDVTEEYARLRSKSAPTDR